MRHSPEHLAIIGLGCGLPLGAPFTNMDNFNPSMNIYINNHMPSTVWDQFIHPLKTWAAALLKFGDQIRISCYTL